MHHRLFMSTIIGNAIRNIHEGVYVSLLPRALRLEETAGFLKVRFVSSRGSAYN